MSKICVLAHILICTLGNTALDIVPTGLLCIYNRMAAAENYESEIHNLQKIAKYLGIISWTILTIINLFLKKIILSKNENIFLGLYNFKNNYKRGLKYDSKLYAFDNEPVMMFNSRTYALI